MESKNLCQGQAEQFARRASRPSGADWLVTCPTKERASWTLVPGFYSFYFCYANLGPEEALGVKWEGRKEKYQREAN